MRGGRIHAASHAAVIAGIAFLTLVDLFATQAILPSLARAYGVSPGAMGFAVNACTIGMALSGLAIALLGGRIDRRKGVVVSLLLLAVPTALLAHAPNLQIFTLLRVTQGLFMSAAFTLTLAYLSERAGEGPGSIAAYVTGNVASNLFGRLLSAAVADHLGLASNFHVFACLNLAGAALAWTVLTRAADRMGPLPAAPAMNMVAGWRDHLANRNLRAAFAIGFCILFAFIGTFTYVNFVLVRAPFALDAMALGFVYLVFVPSIMTTPLAGHAARLFGSRRMFWASLAAAAAGLPLLLASNLIALLAGLALVGAGTFFAQAVATGFVGRMAIRDRAAANGIYLASYFLGGLVGSAVLGLVFMRHDWPGCVVAIGLALVIAAVLGVRLKPVGVSPAVS
ncbi:MAG: MFS transporter [Alphaproteobacteria bacterium]